MEKKYQVFVSSTYQDLIEERDEVMKALLELDCIPSGMELFPSADEEAISYIKKVIDNCDYFISVIGGRYGTEDATGISFTQMEYEYAYSNGIPIIAFVHKSPETLTANKYELDNKKRQKLTEFRKIIEKKLCRYWTSKGELSALVSRSMVKLMKDKPQTGWIRGNKDKHFDFQSEILSKLNELERKNETILKNQEGKIPLDIKVDTEKFDKIELEVTGLQHSKINSEAYEITLVDHISKRKLSIVIGGYEAQSIAIGLEKLTIGRPLTFQLLYNVLIQTGYSVKEVVINKFQDGIHYAKLVITDSFNNLEIDSRTSDALAIAILSGAPIYSSLLVLDLSAVDV